MQQTQQALFDRLGTLKGEVLVLNEDIRQLKKDFTFNKKMNLDGLPKEEVSLIDKAATIHAKNVYEEQRTATRAVFDKYEELSGYNE
jgi:hypothetical protein